MSINAGRRALRLSLCSLLFVLGCEGGDGSGRDGGGSAGEAQGSGSASGASPGVGGSGAGGSSALESSGSRRLTRAEFAASVRALLGADAPVDATLLPLDASAPFDNFAANQLASLSLVEAVDALANELSTWAIDPQRRAALLPCEPTGEDDVGCFRSFIESFGRRALRRPLDEQERAAFEAYFAISQEDGDFYAGVRYAVAAFLSHPRFLYRIEERSGAGVRVLTSYELATRTSYFLTGSGPDDELLDEAESGLVEAPERLRSATERLLETPQGAAQVRRIHALWLGYERFASEGLHGSMRRESDALVGAVALDDRDYFELFTSPETWLEPNLAVHYGLDEPPSAGAWLTAPDGRAGILGHGSVLTASSNTNDTSPTRRGKFIRERLLCSLVPPPPPGVDVDEPPGDPVEGACKEQRYAEHRTRSECAGCHSLMDPIGFGLEQFDELGVYRSHDHERPDCPISGQGELEGYGRFAGPAELGSLLVASGQLEACVTRQLLSFAFGRDLVGDGAAEELIAELQAGFEADQRRLRELLIDVVTSRPFQTRVEEEP